MYHLLNFRAIVKFGLAVSLLLTASVSAFAAPVSPSPSASHVNRLNGKAVGYVSSEYELLPAGKRLRAKPQTIEVYQWDTSPIGERSPFLLVHGLRGEYYPFFRWNEVAKKLLSSSEFSQKYKLYLLRYDSLSSLPKAVPQFRSAITNLSATADKKPVFVLALSLGGNLAYEAMLDGVTDKQITCLFTLGTPFHGSPLFCENWMQYSIMKRFSLPIITKLDHSIGYKFYFKKNPSLLKDLNWDNCDSTIPNVGYFASLIPPAPFGPYGKLNVTAEFNKRLLEINSRDFDKQKLIAYAGYLMTPYMHDRLNRALDCTIFYPYNLATFKIPSHFGKEHPVLQMLCRQICSTVVSEDAKKLVASSFFYTMNDGITPVQSALFLPDSKMANTDYSHESDLEKMHQSADIRLARVFRNVDHLTFIDGYRPVKAPDEIVDELNPKDGKREIFDWILKDVLSYSPALKSEGLAGSAAPPVVPERAQATSAEQDIVRE